MFDYIGSRDMKKYIYCYNPWALPQELTILILNCLLEIIPLNILVSFGFTSGTNYLFNTNYT